jgi:restriction system protein
MAADTTLWGIHGGRTGDADTLFLEHDVVALGWDELGSLGGLPNDRDAFKAAVTTQWPEKTPTQVANNAGQLYRFVHGIQPGDLVAYPSKRDRHIHIGRVTGPYRYDGKTSAGYVHHRPVEWLAHVPRTHFSQGALYEIGSALSLFQVKNYADEYEAALGGTVVGPVHDAPAEVAREAEAIEQATRDFVTKRLARELKGHPFAEFVGHLLNVMGYRTRVSPAGPDHGIDVVAYKDALGLEPPIVKVQVKSGEGQISRPELQQLYGLVETGEYGLFVALGGFKGPAAEFARSKANLRTMDGEEVVDLVLQHYDALDARYKGLLPLRKVYVPEPLDDGGVS